jgi:PAS domain S-box-containing protein
MRHEKKIKVLPAKGSPIPALQRPSVVPTRQEGLLSHLEAGTTLQHEITKRQQAEEALRESEVRFAQFFETLSEGVVIHDNGTILDVNTAMTIISGYPREELVEKPLLDWATSKRCLRTWQSVQSGDERPYETTLQRRDGSSCPVAVRGKTILHHGRRRQAIVVSDLSVRKNLEEALLRAQKAVTEANRIKNEFTATMSHELRTPLNIIIGYADLLLDNTFGELSREQRSAVGNVRRSTVTLIDLITALLNLRNLELGHLSLQPSRVIVADVFDEVEKELAEFTQRSRLIYTRSLDDFLPPLQTDLGKFKLILRNVLNNAFKFTPKGYVTVTAHPRAGGVLIRVADTGIGIPPEQLTAIFSPFFQGDSSDTRPYGGAGLGLHLVQQFLHLLGGTIDVESKVGQGSRFSLWFPASLPL